jgi:hypothetical protein
VRRRAREAARTVSEVPDLRGLAAAAPWSADVWRLTPKTSATPGLITGEGAELGHTHDIRDFIAAVKGRDVHYRRSEAGSGGVIRFTIPVASHTSACRAPDAARKPPT